MLTDIYFNVNNFDAHISVKQLSVIALSAGKVS